MTSVSSPDHKTLLVLTAGFNRVKYMSGANAGGTNPADSNEYVFDYDISKTTPVQKQIIQVANRPTALSSIRAKPSSTSAPA